MIYSGTGYSTLDDLENRLDGAVQRGELTEQEAWDEFQDAAARERYKRRIRKLEEELYLF